MTTPQLGPAQFSEFFEELQGYPPFQWQQRLAERACAGDWPSFIKLPTSSGKTACLDIAVFALACQAAEHPDHPDSIVAPRRIFFVVDRRVIVNEAFQRSQKICDRLEAAHADQDSPLFPVAFWLKSLTRHEHAPPLDCFELRGGIYRDDAWVRSMLQPTILTSTVDQFGSRILFRGYGVSDRNLPIHAALTANDSLVLLDEAHCSKPFSQTVDAITQYRDAGLASDQTAKWSESPVQTPFVFTQMTATPDTNATPEQIFELLPSDYKADQRLNQRHACSKPVRLIESKAKGKRQNALLAKTMAIEAELLANPESTQTPCHRIAIVVNRVACARHTYEILKDKHGDQVHLMIGRMRPYDRESLTQTLQNSFRSDPDRETSQQTDKPQFVVATQCLEVGADFDFDGLVSQCASLDALRQRYGRLNRLGLSSAARGAIVMPVGDIKPKDADPIYGESLPNTWAWLQNHAVESDGDPVVDFGILAMDAVLSETNTSSLRPESLQAPVLLPAHLDLLCQTSPRPAVEPDIANFLHGPDRGQREVRVCWRADLPLRAGKLSDDSQWAAVANEAVAICPPTSAEVLAVPLKQFKQWLEGEDSEDDSSDVLSERRSDNTPSSTAPSDVTKSRYGMIWKGESNRKSIVSYATRNEVRPNDMIVLPVSAGGWDHFGHIPNAPNEPKTTEVIEEGRMRELAILDIAEDGFRQVRHRTLFRIHPALIKTSGDAIWFKSIRKHLNDDRVTVQTLLHQQDEETAEHDSPLAMTDSDAAFGESDMVRQRNLLRDACPEDTKGSRSVQLVRYPGGIALVGPQSPSDNEHRRRLPRASFGDDFDESNVSSDKPVLLADHLVDVAEETARLMTAIPPVAEVASAIIEAARLHDLGKADMRFQAILLKTNPSVASMLPALLAKSNTGTSTKQASGQQISQSLPHGFRHEMLSVSLAQRVEHDLSDDQEQLMLHVIASHHGYARPFAPVVIDDSPVDVSLKTLDTMSDVAISSEERANFIANHQLDSGIGDRFWGCNRRFGWWGLAWLETAVRLSDWTASAVPVQREAQLQLKARSIESKTQTIQELVCSGIDGSNPLGFLSALGLLRSASELFPGCKMIWRRNGTWTPVLQFAEVVSESDLITALHSHLSARSTERHFTELGQNTTVPQVKFKTTLLAAREDATSNQRATVDFYAAFGTDGLVSENDDITIQDTALRTMAGAGHQHFLETMRNVIEKCSADQLRKTLFETWKYDDPTQTLSLRFDPLDDNRYALRWRNPSGDPDRKKSGSILGANRLAIEGIPFFITAPGPRFLQTVGFQGHRSRDTFFRWPIWTVPISANVVGSLLANGDIQTNRIESLQAVGVAAIFQSQRITIGKVRNFTPAHLVTADIQA